LSVTDAEYNRTRWHSRRGMLELDLVLVPFVEHHFRGLDDVDQGRYLRLLECEDTDLFRWFLRAERPGDAELDAIVTTILDRHHDR